MNGNKYISVHHIGGRGGDISFPSLDKFREDIFTVIYDADKECIEEICSKNDGNRSRLAVLPYCLSDFSGKASFNINNNPYTSSLFETNPDLGLFHAEEGKHDYIWREETRLIEKRDVDVVTLDQLMSQNNIQVPPPDFLSIDAQGAAYNILVGGKNTLRASVLALEVELEFQPLYKGQKLFCDNVKFLSDQGFQFVRFTKLCNSTPVRNPIGLRGNGFHVFTEALFLRKIDDIEKIGDPSACLAMLRKLAFISIVFGQFEYGLECLSRSFHIEASNKIKEEAAPKYLRFLKEFKFQADKAGKIYLITPDYAGDAAKNSSFMGLMKQGLKRRKSIHMFMKLLKSIIYSVMRFGSTAMSKLFGRYSGTERVLIRYGLKEQANVLRRKRETLPFDRTYVDYVSKDFK